MAAIRAFRALRPRKDLAEAIAALPYDVYSSEEARQVVRENPMSFLKIDRAETQMAEGTDLYSDSVYARAADTLQEMIREGAFLREETPCLYIYELTMNGRIQTGIGACVAVQDYERQVVRRHENTRQEKEDDRTRHIQACGAQTGPIFLAYRYHEELAQILTAEKEKPAEYDFVSEDGIRHRLWVIRQDPVIRRIEQILESVGTLYIADGHHRAASAVRTAKTRRAGEAKETTARMSSLPEYEFFLSVLFADRDLLVMDYNRWVKDLKGHSRESFLEKLRESFSVQPLKHAVHPEKKGQFTMDLEGDWYLLEEKNPDPNRDCVERLDVSILQEQVLRPLLGIQNPRTDERISFIGGIRGLAALEELVNEQGGVAFALYPTSMKELFDVADAGRLMPPKSTWFEPKLRSGLLIHEI